MLWLRMVWLVGAGNPHLMQSAWRVHSERVEEHINDLAKVFKAMESATAAARARRLGRGGLQL